MTSEHTPGPWEAVGSGIYAQVYLPDKTVWFPLGYTLTAESAEANSRLIAAAPDLLDVAETVLELVTVEMPVELVNKAFAAVEKAKGETKT